MRHEPKEQMVPATPSPGKASGESVFHKGFNFLFGHDFFISYAWADAREYAVALAEKLKAQGFECFLDSSGFEKGEDWTQAGGRALRKTSRLLLLSTPAAHRSVPVLREVTEFKEGKRLILPIEFPEAAGKIDPDSPLAGLLPPEILRIIEAPGYLSTGPSETVLADIRGSFNLLRQNQKRIRWLSAGLVLLTVVAAAAVTAGLIAENRRKEAFSRGLAAQAFIEGGRQLDLALLLAAEAEEIRSTNQSRSSLLGLIQSTHVEGYIHLDSVAQRVAAHPVDATVAAVATGGGTVEIVDVARHTRTSTLAVGKGPVFAMGFSNDGKYLCGGGMDRELVVWESSGTGYKEIARAPVPGGQIIRCLHVLPEGRVLVGSDSVGLLSYSITEGVWKSLPEVHDGQVCSIIDWPSQGLVIAGTNGRVVFWNPTGSNPTPLRGFKAGDLPLCMAAARDGRWLAVGTYDKGVELWDSKELVMGLRVPARPSGGRVFAVGFAKDAPEVMYAGDDGSVSSFKLSDGTTRHSFVHSDAILDFEHTADGGRFITAGRDRKVSVWDLNGVPPLSRRLVEIQGNRGWITATAMDDEHDVMMLGDEGGNLIAINTVTGKQETVSTAHEGRLNSIISAGVGGTFASCGADGKLRRWRLADGVPEPQGEVPPPEMPLVKLLRLDSGGSIIGVTGSGILYRCGPGHSPLEIGRCLDKEPGRQPLAFALHPRLPVVAVGGQHGLVLHDWMKRTRVLAEASAGFSGNLEFSPSGEELYGTAGSDFEVRDPATGEKKFTIQCGRVPAGDWAISKSGTLLCVDSECRLTWWDFDSRMELGTGFRLPAVDSQAVCYSAKQDRWITMERTYANGVNRYLLRSWSADSAAWAGLARKMANRGLTDLEKSRFGF